MDAKGSSRTSDIGVLVTERLGALEEVPRKSRRARLVAALRDLIETELLGQGALLPSDRDLAVEVGVSRGTVVAALDELAQEGLVERLHGSGTYVAPAPAAGGGDDKRRQAGALLREHWLRNSAPIYDLAASVLPDHAHLDLRDIDVAALLAGHPPHGYLLDGHPGLREQLADRLAPDGLVGGPNRLMVTTGGQQGLYLAVQVLVSTGDRVLVQSPTYPGLLAALLDRGAEIATIDGSAPLVPNVLRQVLREVQPVAAFLDVAVNNPVGWVASDDQAAALGRELDRAQVWLVEDRTLADLVYPGVDRPRALATWVSSAVTVGSLSKLLWGGLRVGWVHAPDGIFGTLKARKQMVDLATGAVAQELGAILLERFTTDRHAALIHDLRERTRVFEQELTTALPEWRWASPDGGLSLWAEIGAEPAADLAARAAEVGVAVAAGNAFAEGGVWGRHVRLNTGLASAAAGSAIRRLADAASL